MSAPEDLYLRARKVLASGRWNPSGDLARIGPVLLPILAVSSQGCRTIDAAGRSYLDLMMGWGTALLGFRHPAVERAIREQLEKGTTPSLTSPLEVEVAEELCALVPCAEQVAFGKNGSDVLALTVRVARAYTGRERVLVHGYHGIHDWYMASVPQCLGIPRSQRELVAAFPYDDLPALRARLEKWKGEVAAVVMEPVIDRFPSKGYLEGVRSLCSEFGAVLVFDEVMTGWRLARGGAQDYFGVLPDLACYAKSLANGMPLAALVGPRRLDEAVSACLYGLTFRGEMLSLAAARAALAVYRDEPVSEHVWRAGDRLRAALQDSAEQLGVAVELCGPSPRMSFRFTPTPSVTGRDQLALFVQECLLRGVLHNGHLLMSYAHDEAALEEAGAAFHAALEVVGRALVRNGVEGLLHIPRLQLWLEEES